MRFFGVCLVATILFVQSGLALQAQDIKVLVLDALSGKPQANVRVEYYCMGAPLNTGPYHALTNAKGMAIALNYCTGKQEIDISVFPRDNKEQCGIGNTTLHEIIANGYVAKPKSDGGIWCPDKVSKKLPLVPGQIILFVKKPTWWQSHVAG